MIQSMIIPNMEEYAAGMPVKERFPMMLLNLNRMERKKLIPVHKPVCPQFDIADHRDRDRLNNLRDNLRDGGNGVNDSNRSVYKNNLTGVRGVDYLKKKGKYRAFIGIHIGLYDTIEEAESSYIDAKAKCYEVLGKPI